MIIPIERGRASGLPIIWEAGGGFSNTSADNTRVICGPKGEALRPVYRPGRVYMHDASVYFTLRQGTHVVLAGRAHGHNWADVHPVVEIKKNHSQKQEVAVLGKAVAGWQRGEYWGDSCFKAAIDAALEKAECYHCRDAHYVEPDQARKRELERARSENLSASEQFSIAQSGDRELKEALARNPFLSPDIQIMMAKKEWHLSAVIRLLGERPLVPEAASIVEKKKGVRW